MATVAATDERIRRLSLGQRLVSRPELGAAIGAIAVFVIFSIVAGGRGFLTTQGAATYLQVAAEIGILGAAVALLMIAGEFDLSIGSMVGAAGMVAALCMAQFGLPAWLSVLIAFAFALGVGALNGYLVIRTRLPSFIVTLGTLFILRGVTIGTTRFVTGRTQVGGLGTYTRDDPITPLFTAELAGFDVSILWWIGLRSATGSTAPAGTRRRPATSACRWRA
jgi:simple sugar transport system permease protein